MIQMMITTEEQALLAALLENAISDLRTEIVDTDRFEYREMLKNRKALMNKLLQELTQIRATEAVP
jgi:hypothetical protein